MIYHKVNPTSYEAARLELDAALQLPEGDTLFAPASIALRAPDNDCLVAFRDEHMVGPVLMKFQQLEGSGNAVLITGAEYEQWTKVDSLP